MPLTLAPPPLSREDALTRRLHQVAGRLRRTIVLRAGARLVFATLLLVVVLGHRVVLTPTKLAEARQRGMTAVMDGFADECLTLAPPPMAQLDEPPADG